MQRNDKTLEHSNKQNKPGFIQYVWRFFTGPSKTDDLSNSSRSEKNSNDNFPQDNYLAESLSGVHISFYAPTDKSSKRDEIASPQNSLIETNDAPKEMANTSSKQGEKLLSNAESNAAPAPSLIPAKKQPMIKDEKNNPLIRLLKKTNTYLTKRAKETQSFPYNIFGFGADDYHARRDHWRSTLELLCTIAKTENASPKLTAKLIEQLKDGILQFNKGRGQYARCLAGILLKIQSFDQGSFVLMAKGAANYIERSHNAYSELDKLRQPVSDFAACSIFKPAPDTVKQGIAATLNVYADVVKLDNPIQNGRYIWNTLPEFLSPDEVKKTEYHNVTSRKLV